MNRITIGICVVLAFALSAGIGYLAVPKRAMAAPAVQIPEAVRAVNTWSGTGVWNTTAANLGLPVCRHNVTVAGSWTTTPTSQMFTVTGSNDGVNYQNINSFWASLSTTTTSYNMQIVNACYQNINVVWNSFTGTNNGTTTVTVLSGGVN